MDGDGGSPAAATHGRVQVNAHPLQQEDHLYRFPDGQPVKPSQVDVDVTVPAGRIFVMGDHRDSSAGSRCHLDDPVAAGQPAGMSGCVDLEAVVGPVVATVAPVDRWRRSTAPDAFGSVPEPAGRPRAGRPAPAVPAVRHGVTDCREAAQAVSAECDGPFDLSVAPPRLGAWTWSRW